MSVVRRPSLACVSTALVLACGLAACGDGDGDDEPVDASAIPAGSVAVVGDQTVTARQLDRRIRAVRRSQRGDNRQSREQLRSQALTMLLQQAALEQETDRAGREVTDVEVRRRFDQARSRFPDRRSYKRFLGDQTTSDVLFQIRMQLLGEKAGEMADAGADPADFARQMQQRWSDRTACRAGYSSPLCGR